MREAIDREPYHTERITMTFKSKTHITDVAFEAVTIARMTQCDVSIELEGWRFEVTPHMDVPEIVEAYQKQPGWFVETETPKEYEVIAEWHNPDFTGDKHAATN